MTTATKLPAVLVPPKPNSAISMERALKQIKRLLEEHVEAKTFELEDSLSASIDDLDVMLACIDRG